MTPISRRHSLVALAALSASAGRAWPQAAVTTTAPLPLDKLLQQRAARDGVGFAAVQVRAGEAPRISVAGVMRRGSPRPVSDTTLFELGSITKVFVALLLADAVLRGVVSLDDPIEAGLPDGLTLRDGRGEPLRFIDVATHRSGLPRMPTNLRPTEMQDPYAGYTEARLMAFVRDWKQVVGRGQRFEYSNLGYGLLALTLSRLQGRRFDDLLAERVLKPLALTEMRLLRPLPAVDDLQRVAAALVADRASAPNEASGHTAAREPVLPWRFDALAGAGGLLASANALGRFMQAALGEFEHPLGDAFALCMRRHANGDDPLHAVGLGWEVAPLRRHLVFNQDGATVGSSCSMWLDPSRRSGAAVLCNTFVETNSTALYALDPTITPADFRLFN